MKLKPSTVSNARNYFSTELRTIMEQRRLNAQNGAFEYLVELLVKNLESNAFFTQNQEGKWTQPTLLEIYSQYLQGDHAQKVISLQRLGDVCMMVTGIFPDSLKRKLVDIDYYQGMGGSAYHQLSISDPDSSSKNIFFELAQKFKMFADILSEFSEKSGLQTNADLLRLYEKWLLTGSERLRTLLKEKGILSVPVDPKTRH